MDELLYREEMMWLQRSRISWLKEGDRNTKFFQNKAIWRSRRNKIKQLKRADGSVCNNQNEMGEMASSYFENLFTKDDRIRPDMLLDKVQAKVTQDMNMALCRDFTDQEIEHAIFQIGPLKAPSPDGFPARFFHNNWEVIKKDVLAAVKVFCNTCKISEGVNETQ
jgi:hypothetical protein